MSNIILKDHCHQKIFGSMLHLCILSAYQPKFEQAQWAMVESIKKTTRELRNSIMGQRLRIIGS